MISFDSIRFIADKYKICNDFITRKKRQSLAFILIDILIICSNLMIKLSLRVSNITIRTIYYVHI